MVCGNGKGSFYWIGSSKYRPIKKHGKSKLGLITLENSGHDLFPSEDERYSDEMYYAAKSNMNYDLKLAARWLGKLRKAKKKIL